MREPVNSCRIRAGAWPCDAPFVELHSASVYKPKRMKLPSVFLGLLLSAAGAACGEVTPALPAPFSLEDIQTTKSAPPGLAILTIQDNASNDHTVTATWNGFTQTLTNRGRIGLWTLMEVIAATDGPIAVFEDVRREDGRMVFVRPSGVVADLSKSLEATFALEPSKLYHGHTLNEVFDSATDLLGREILAQPGDPEYAEVAACFPPLRRGTMTHTFVGTRENSDKVGFDYGGRTSHFDPAFMLLRSGASAARAKCGTAWLEDGCPS